MIAALEQVLLDARALCARPDNDFLWSSWRDVEHAVGELDDQLAELRRTARGPWGVGTLFAPTGPMQELALSSGWGERFLELADRADAAVTRLDLLGRLRERLAAGREPAVAAAAPDGIGVTVEHGLDVRVTLVLDPPVDAAELCRAWHVPRPVAVSGDVDQRRWMVVAAGAELPDPHGRRIAAVDVRAGAWMLDALLTGRPAGPLPGVSCGASPAYDLLEREGRVARIEIRPGWH